MTGIEKSVKQMVTKANLRVVGLLAPHQDMRESTAGSATGTEVPEQQQDVPQPPPRRATGVTINETTGALRPAAAPAPLGKDMLAERAFDLYAKSASKKKSHKRQSGEGYSNLPMKKSRTDDPPAPTPTKETTPPPAPAREATPTPPVNLDPSSPVGQNPPPAPADLTPPTSTIQ
ncbi:proline-rich receptor-like protein kinase PERK10 [Humulus lupulus]|uniref:proline-rich receptor-like protein kinase PERK10 n=1 Tax=Humulus lupulus TaxID=3486 RepID=UPI002B413A8A|nr:proline-rich receptor-like protein kinase PERK10 [Humulus lupulus]